LGTSVLAGVGWWIYSTRPAYRLRQAQASARSGEYENALHLADQLESAGHADEAALARGEVFFRRGQNREALGWLKRVRKDRADLFYQAAVLNAQILIAQKLPREATQVLAFVLNENPDYIDAHRWLATIYYDQGDATRALPHLQEVARLEPADYRPHRLTALILKDMDMEDDAIPAYHEALNRKPPSVERDEIRLELADCQMKQFRYADALATLGEIQAPEAAMFRVDAFTALGKLADAERTLASALEEHPDHGGLLRLQGARAAAAGNFSDAVRILERVAALDPYDNRTRYQLALAYEGLKQPEKAAEQHKRHQELKKLVQTVAEKSRDATKDPWNESIRWELAELCDKLGRPQLAEMWRTAAKACRSER
jgi:tetratricopeptide (TPR) repeat protein